MPTIRATRSSAWSRGIRPNPNVPVGPVTATVSSLSPLTTPACHTWHPRYTAWARLFWSEHAGVASRAPGVTCCPGAGCRACPAEPGYGAVSRPALTPQEPHPRRVHVAPARSKLQQHGRGVHVLWSGTRGAGVTGVRYGVPAVASPGLQQAHPTGFAGSRIQPGVIAPV